MIDLKNAGYYYMIVDTKGDKRIYEQWDKDSVLPRLVGYEVWKGKGHWKTVFTLERAYELMNRVEEPHKRIVS